MSNRYTRAIKQLKNKTLDEKLQLLSEIPTNNTGGIFVDTPGTLTPERIEPGEIDSELNLSQDGDGSEEYTGDDTTGLFTEDGTIRAIEPPGDTSYVLGPMISMWYAWANYTQIGYVRQSDRRMVNLGRITGELENWDGSSGFTSYGQLTLEQAVWFKNQSRSDYRAFYPGPPSNPADEFGRYLGSMIDSTKSVFNFIRSLFTPGTQKGFDPSDVFSSLMDRLGDAFNPIKDLIDSLGYQAEKLVNGLTDGLDVLNDVRSILDRAEQNNSILPPGHELGDPNFPDRPTLVPGSEGSRENPFQTTLSDTTNATLMNGITRDMSPSELRAQVQKNINTDFNFGAKGTLNNLTSDPYFDSEGNLVIKDTYAFDPGGDIADKPFLFGGTTGDFAKNFSNDPERQKDVLTMFDKSIGNLIPGTPDRNDPVVHFEIKIPPPNPKVQARQDFQKTMSMDNFNKLSKSDQNKVMDALKKRHVSKRDGSNFIDAPKHMRDTCKAQVKQAQKTKFKDGYMIDKDPITGKSRKTPIFSTIPGMSSVLVMGNKPSGKLLTENQKRIIRDIKKPVQVKEIPTKVKVSPKLRNKNKTVGGDMMKTPNVPNQFKPPAPNIWAAKDREANIRASQEKKNQVLELVGAAEHHWTYLTEESRKKKQEKVNEMMSAEYDKQMELLYEKHRIKESKIDKAISAFRKPTDIKPEFPKEPPPQMDPKTGMHPKYGKNYKHDKLDPQSAEAMPPTGNPEIDANIKKATNAKEKARKLKILMGKTKRG